VPLTSALPPVTAGAGTRWTHFAAAGVYAGSGYAPGRRTKTSVTLDLARDAGTAGLDATTGRVLWRQPGTVTDCGGRIALTGRAIRCRYQGTITSTAGTRTTRHTNLRVAVEAFDPRTGRTRWSVPLPAAVPATVVTPGPSLASTSPLSPAPLPWTPPVPWAPLSSPPASEAPLLSAPDGGDPAASAAQPGSAIAPGLQPGAPAGPGAQLDSAVGPGAEPEPAPVSRPMVPTSDLSARMAPASPAAVAKLAVGDERVAIAGESTVVVPGRTGPVLLDLRSGATARPQLGAVMWCPKRIRFAYLRTGPARSGGDVFTPCDATGSPLTGPPSTDVASRAAARAVGATAAGFAVIPTPAGYQGIKVTG
jgi:hypothetical protein